MAANLNVEEVIEKVFEEVSGGEEVSGDDESVDEGEERAEDDVLLDPNIDAIIFLKTRPIYPRNIYILESKIWLETIHRRLNGRRRIRQPFCGSITRNIPMEVFNVLVPLVNKLGFSRPSCYVERNGKAVVVFFTDINTTTRFLSVLSAIPPMEIVERYFHKTLKGRKSGSTVEVLVREEKQFGLAYNIRRGQLDISFFFGEWNTYGFPQHN